MLILGYFLGVHALMPQKTHFFPRLKQSVLAPVSLSPNTQLALIGQLAHA